jgi:hypothetical protein
MLSPLSPPITRTREGKSALHGDNGDNGDNWARHGDSPETHTDNRGTARSLYNLTYARVIRAERA